MGHTIYFEFVFAACIMYNIFFSKDRLSLFFFFCPLQFATEETKKGPLVVFLKDIEKFIAGVDTHSMKTKLELVPVGVFIIGSHIQADSRKEKVFCLFSSFTCIEDHPCGILYD
jgi:hypothetical protein